VKSHETNGDNTQQQPAAHFAQPTYDRDPHTPGKLSCGLRPVLLDDSNPLRAQQEGKRSHGPDGGRTRSTRCQSCFRGLAWLVLLETLAALDATLCSRQKRRVAWMPRSRSELAVLDGVSGCRKPSGGQRDHSKHDPSRRNETGLEHRPPIIVSPVVWHLRRRNRFRSPFDAQRNERRFPVAKRSSDN
jgi:hypothetical protein